MLNFGLIFIFCNLITMQVQAVSPTVVYGKDDRVDTFESQSRLFRNLAKSTAAMIPKSAIVFRGNTAEIHAEALAQTLIFGAGKLPVCEKERFSHQPTAARCSGFLVSKDLMATAGHCMQSLSDCNDHFWVFNYKVSDGNQTAVSVSSNDIYECKKVVGMKNTLDKDAAVIQLDRITSAKPVKLAKSDPSIGTPLVMIGYPSGLPQKISDGSRIYSASAQSFTANLDAFQINSGSAVFNALSGELLGILVLGKTDYKQNSIQSCMEVNYLPDDEAGEVVSSFRQIIPFLKKGN